MEGKRTKQSEGPLITESNKLEGNFNFKGKPAFVKERYFLHNLEMICLALSKKELTKFIKKLKNQRSP